MTPLHHWYGVRKKVGRNGERTGKECKQTNTWATEANWLVNSWRTWKFKSRYWSEWDLDLEYPHANTTHWPIITGPPPLRTQSLRFRLPVVWKPAKKKVIDCAMISSSLNLLTPFSFSSCAFSINCTRSFEPVNSFFRLSCNIPFRIFPKKSMFCRKFTYL